MTLIRLVPRAALPPLLLLATALVSATRGPSPSRGSAAVAAMRGCCGGIVVLAAAGLLVSSAASGLGLASGPVANLTLYHEFQPRFERLGLANQDTGDVRGDAYFVLRSLFLPVECSDPNSKRGDCENAESNSTQNVVSRNTVLASTSFGAYASCNADDHTNSYHCACPGGPCKAPVGRIDVKQRELSHGHPRTGAAAWEWWRLNLALKMSEGVSGYWYSTTDAGDCSIPNATSSCTWKLEATTRKIVAQCLETRVTEAVRKAGPACFSGCAQPQNSSSPCVVGCYMSTILGVEGGSRLIATGEGIDPQLIVQAWEAAFDSADPAKGGCPDAPAAAN